MCSSIFHSIRPFLKGLNFYILKLLSGVQLFATPWIVACQAPLSMGFSRQECWSGLPFLFPGNLPDPGIEPWSPALQTDSLSEPPSFWVGHIGSLCFPS